MRPLFALMVATWFGSGLIPPVLLNGMAGTYGSLAAIPVCYVALWSSTFMAESLFLQIIWYLFFTSCIFCIGLWSIPIAEATLGPRRDWRGKVREHDQSQIVVDEIIGMLTTCMPLLWIRHNPAVAFFAAFVFFRLFDITKLWPGHYFDRMERPVGVLLDDVVAGIYAAIALVVFLEAVGP